MHSTQEYVEGDNLRIVVVENTITTKTYRFRQVKNGIISEPAIYKNNGRVYYEAATYAQTALDGDDYSLTIQEIH